MRKHLRWSVDGRQYRRSAKTRSWQQAEEEKRKIEDQFKVGGQPQEVAPDARVTIARAIELFLLDNQGLNREVRKKYERELSRFRVFMESRSRFFPAEVDKEQLIEYWVYRSFAGS